MKQNANGTPMRLAFSLLLVSLLGGCVAYAPANAPGGYSNGVNPSEYYSPVYSDEYYSPIYSEPYFIFGTGWFYDGVRGYDRDYRHDRAPHPRERDPAPNGYGDHPAVHPRGSSVTPNVQPRERDEAPNGYGDHRAIHPRDRN